MRSQESRLSASAGLVDRPLPYEASSDAHSKLPPPSIILRAGQSCASTTSRRGTVRLAESGCDGFLLLETLSAVQRQIFLNSAVVGFRVEVEIPVLVAIQTLACSGVLSWALDSDGKILGKKRCVGLVVVHPDLRCVAAVDSLW